MTRTCRLKIRRRALTDRHQYCHTPTSLTLDFEIPGACKMYCVAFWDSWCIEDVSKIPGTDSTVITHSRKDCFICDVWLSDSQSPRAEL